MRLDFSRLDKAVRYIIEMANLKLRFEAFHPIRASLRRYIQVLEKTVYEQKSFVDNGRS